MSANHNVNLTAKQHVVDHACQKCGTFVRNINTNACIECDRVRQRKKWAATHPNYKPRVGKKLIDKPKKLIVEKNVQPDPMPAESKILNNPVNIKNSNVPLKQPLTDFERHLLSDKLNNDLRAFLENGGKVSHGGAK